jgi:integral membrane protein (TIGR01906 family)
MIRGHTNVDKTSGAFLRWIQRHKNRLPGKEAALGLFRALIIALFILAVPVALVTTNIRIAISEKAVYDYAVRNYGAEKASGISEAELIRANGEIRDYLVNQPDGALSPTVTNLDGDEEVLFDVRETAHMADVRDLVGTLFAVQVLAVALVISLAVLMLVLWPPRALAAAAFYGSVLTAIILGLASLLALAGFDSAWSQFHVVAFTNDFWELNPATDHLIQMYPEAFWFDVTMLIGIATLAQAVAISALSAVYLVATAPPPPEPRALPDPRPDLPRPEHLRNRIAPPDPRHYSG